MNDGYRVYCSDWLYGFGRFIVITTSQYEANGKDITSEAFVFAFDTAPQEKRFNARIINYKANLETEGIINIDLKFMEEEAQRQARNLIYEYQYEKYKKTKDTDLMDRTFKLSLCDKDALISLKISGDYEPELRTIIKDSKSEDLKKYLSLILSLPKLEIRDIK
jgi:hypothetical protein